MIPYAPKFQRPFGGSLSAAAAYRAAVLADSPVAYWRLGETIGTTAVDEMGSYDGTYVGSPTPGASGIFAGNLAVSFDGVNDMVTRSHESALASDLTAGWTVEAWVKPSTIAGGDSFSSTNPRIIIQKGGVAFGSNYFLRLLGGKISFGYRNSTNTAWVEQLTSSAVVTVGAWQHVAAVHTGAAIALYHNGVAVPSSLAGTIAAANQPAQTLWMGAQDGSQRRLVGGLDEVAIYPAALSAARIAAHYAAAGY